MPRLALITSILLFSSVSFAANSRKATFSYVTTNRIKVPVNQSVTSTCTISVTNSSASEQELELEVNATATGDFAGPAKISSDSKNPNTKITLAPKTGTQNFTFEYPTIPAYRIATQTLLCVGTINVTGNAAPGFVTASGAVTTFQESSRMTDHSNPGSKQVTTGRVGLFRSQSFLINQGAPF